MNKYSAPPFPSKWYIVISKENEARLEAYLRANSHKYSKYSSAWKVNQQGGFFVSEGKNWHSTFERETAERLGYVEIDDHILTRVILKNFYTHNPEKLPEKWYIKGGKDLSDLLKEFDTSLVGLLKDRAYYTIPSGAWVIINPKFLDNSGYTEISVEQFRRLSTHNRETNYQTIIQKQETMQTHTETNPEITKEVTVTKPVKIKTIKKGKAVYIEREVTLYVGVAEDNEVYTGYSIRNPEFDKTHDEAMAIKIAKNRAFNNKTNLSRGEWITAELKTKFVLKGIAEQFFSKISKGQVLQISKA